MRSSQTEYLTWRPSAHWVDPCSAAFCTIPLSCLPSNHSDTPAAFENCVTQSSRKSLTWGCSRSITLAFDFESAASMHSMVILGNATPTFRSSQRLSFASKIRRYWTRRCKQRAEKPGRRKGYEITIECYHSMRGTGTKVRCDVRIHSQGGAQDNHHQLLTD